MFIFFSIFFSVDKKREGGEGRGGEGREHGNYTEKEK
jgi:hypothetical protein